MFIYFCVKNAKQRIRIRAFKFPKLKLKKDGIQFFSFKQHKINFKNGKFVQIGNVTYMNVGESLIRLKNVDRVFIYEGCLFFTGLGKVDINFDCSSFYKYFNIEILSDKFSLEEQKQNAILELINKNFQINFCKVLKNYIKSIKNILNIHIFQKKLVIRQNKLHLSFVLKYKINNKIKLVYINETLEEKR